MKKSLFLQLMAAMAAVAPLPASALIETPLASYEPSETDLTVTANPGDSGLTVSIVQGGVGGAPAATDGSYLLKVDVVNETDRKVEFIHDWSASTYNLAGEDELLADVYIATSSAIPSIMGVWDANWNPPDAWQPATGIPTQVGVWTTISFDVSARSQVGLDQIWAFIFEGMAGTTGTAYVDNLRFSRAGSAPYPAGVAATAYQNRIDLVWRASSDPGLQGYNVYRAESQVGPFAKLNGSLLAMSAYTDPAGEGSPRYFYYVTTVIGGQESDPSDVVSALYNGMTDADLMDTVQEATLQYFWAYGHPNSGMAREGWNMGHGSDVVTTGGTGMGLITIMVGAERGFITRAEAAARILQILSFLDVDASRYHGAWSHHLNGVTGETIPFSEFDDGGDLVETAFLVQGMLTVRQYFDDPVDEAETQIRTLATSMWEDVEWDWYRRFPDSDLLYWHWSPNFGWQMNMPIAGYNEAMIVYLLAIASPTHPMPASSYYNGWAGDGWYANGNYYYGYQQWVGPAYGGPLFFTHYSNLGFDPRYKKDAYCNYHDNARNISLIHQAYCADNPGNYAGYSEMVWGLTACFNPWGYDAHSPTNDNGTIAPTAAIMRHALHPPGVPGRPQTPLRHLRR